jgi:hypothetical protein
LFDFSCRGKAGKLQGNLMGVMAVLKGTPTTYNKDFQECWELMFDSVDALHDCIRIATGVLSTIKINPDKMMKVTHVLFIVCVKPIRNYFRFCWCAHVDVNGGSSIKQREYHQEPDRMMKVRCWVSA